MQQSSLKALAGAVLQRNKQRNSNATGQEKPRNKHPENQTCLLRVVAPLFRYKTVDEAHDALDRLGDWTGVVERVGSQHSPLMDAARQASREADHNPRPAAFWEYYRTWRIVYFVGTNTSPTERTTT
jgi:hypothetical protein